MYMLEKHKTKRAYKLPIKAASLKRVKANAAISLVLKSKPRPPVR